MTKLTKAAQDVLAERERQVSEEGWSHEHDDSHGDESLAMAAACYAAPKPIYLLMRHREGELSIRDPWPWGINFRGNPCRDFTGWNKKDKPRRQQLVIAAGLLLAEIERLDRAEG